MPANCRRRAQRVPTSILWNARIFQKHRAASEESIKINRIVISSPVESASTCIGRKRRGGEKVSWKRRGRSEKETSRSRERWIIFLLDKSYVGNNGRFRKYMATIGLCIFMHSCEIQRNTGCIFMVCLKLYRTSKMSVVKLS